MPIIEFHRDKFSSFLLPLFSILAKYELFSAFLRHLSTDRPSIPCFVLSYVIQLSPREFSRTTCAELGVGLAFVQPMAWSISQQLIEHRRKFPGWALEGTIAPAAENIQLLDIDVRFRSVVYRDRVRWDVNCLHNSPERFARSTVADLNLPQASFTRIMRRTVNSIQSMQV